MAKLFEATYGAWIVVCFQEMHRIGRFLADFDDVVDFIDAVHFVRLDGPVMFPGVIPNAELFLKSYDLMFLRLILKFARYAHIASQWYKCFLLFDECP